MNIADNIMKKLLATLILPLLFGFNSYAEPATFQVALLNVSNEVYAKAKTKHAKLLEECIENKIQNIDIHMPTWSNPVSEGFGYCYGKSRLLIFSLKENQRMYICASRNISQDSTVVLAQVMTNETTNLISVSDVISDDGIISVVKASKYFEAALAPE
jgi:hypothetical protein